MCTTQGLDANCCRPRCHTISTVLNSRATTSQKYHSTCRNVKRCRGGLVFEAHRLVYHSTLGSRAITRKTLRERPELHRSSPTPRRGGGGGHLSPRPGRKSSGKTLVAMHLSLSLSLPLCLCLSLSVSLSPSLSRAPARSLL